MVKAMDSQDAGLSYTKNSTDMYYPNFLRVSLDLLRADLNILSSLGNVDTKS